MLRKRAGALHIQDHKLLLISEGGQDFYWTPGGGIETGESPLQALARELDEELGAVLKTATSFLKLNDEAKNEEIEYFLVDIDLPSTMPGDTKIFWYSKNDFKHNTPNISKRIYDQVYPELMAAKLI